MSGTGQPGSRWLPPGSGVRNVGAGHGRSARSNGDNDHFQVTKGCSPLRLSLWPAEEPPISAHRGVKERTWKAAAHILGRPTVFRRLSTPQ